MKILCRADGNSEIGLGHLYRMIAIAEFYKDNYEIIFLTHAASLPSVIPSEFKKQTIPKGVSIKDEPDWIKLNFNPSEYTIIADGYQFISSYQKKIKELGYPLMYIDDLLSEHMYADIVVNHSPHCFASNFDTEQYTTFALGTPYAMLRPSFNKAALETREIGPITDAIICFGGADQYDLSLKASKALLNIDTFEKIHIVLGGAYKHKEIYTLQDKEGKIFLHKNLDETTLCDLMKSCQIGIAPSSTILYEMCSVKMPILSGFFVENQKNIYLEFVKKRVIFEGGNFAEYTVSDFEDKINGILKNPLTNSIIKKQNQLFDGQSKTRFLGLLNRLNVLFRKASEQDLMQVYNWSNDVLVRKNSYNSSKIDIESHTKWYLEKINNKDTLFLITLINNKAGGVVRYEIGKNYSVVGILLSKEYRGQKLSSVILKKSAQQYFKNNTIPIYAYIKKKNIASIKSFEKAGYTFLKEEIIKGNISFVYKLEKKDA
ncbi:UDP-2,4-diacetamido-2,4,6-trideoxy-beta-L-altropyranose hydrolase [Lacinutrix mariniflava]|uniref:UDP-2,4-diacetamido-2,4, 6-trideoxy-beta-L-altropyranose hydrolase n=1 Tax=Lacinutrix mariniflava TaxID=342955 RepID=UPI0006E2140D|nr:UDP-2,4-diacetamido-2,4,6-trideoxy-beta-L-altropyranose hydrolase [Lacinutrix mariniflava]